MAGYDDLDERRPEYRFSVFGVGRGDHAAYECMRQWAFYSIDEARRFRAEVDADELWRRKYLNFEISDITGPDVRPQRITAESWRAGIDQVRRILSQCRGPLAAPMAKSVRVKVDHDPNANSVTDDVEEDF